MSTMTSREGRTTSETAESRSVLRRAMSLLNTFSETDTFLPLAEIVRRSKLPKTTAHRLTAELVEFGLLERGTYGYRVGLKMFELGQLAPRARTLRERALPYLEDLQVSTEMAVNLAVRDGTEVVYLDILSPLRGMPLPSRIGARLPAHSSALGKIILAHSDESVVREILRNGLPRYTYHTLQSPDRFVRMLLAARDEGIAHDDQETVRGIACLAAPVFCTDGSLLAAISVTSRTTRLPAARVEKLLRTTASDLSRSPRRPLGHG